MRGNEAGRIGEERGPGKAMDECVLECYHGEIVRLDADDFERVNEYRWSWDNTVGGAYRKEPVGKFRYDRKVWLHREIMGEEDEFGCAGFLPEGICVGFLDENRNNCCRSNLFLYRQGDKKRALARARAGVYGGGTFDPPPGAIYETLGCICGAKTRVRVNLDESEGRCRCGQCRRKLDNKSL